MARRSAVGEFFYVAVKFCVAQHRGTHSIVEFTQVATSKTYRALVKSGSRSRMRKGMMQGGGTASWGCAGIR